MTSNSPVVSIRVPPLLLAAIDAEIKRRNDAGAIPPYTRSTFLLVSADLELAREAERAKVVPIKSNVKQRLTKLAKMLRKK